MPFNPNVPAEQQKPRKADARANVMASFLRIGQLPDDFSSVAQGRILTVGPSGAILENTTFHTDGNPLGGFISDDGDISGNTTITQAHLAKTLEYAGSNAVTLTINSDATGVAGVKDKFAFTVMRADGAGKVTFVLGTGLQNQDSARRASIAAGGMVTVKVKGNRVYLAGALET